MDWYDRLRKFLLEKMFQQGKIDKTLFITKTEHDILLVQIYVDDIISGSTNVSLWKELYETMKNEFEMSVMGERKYFTGLQIHKSKKVTFINQAK